MLVKALESQEESPGAQIKTLTACLHFSKTLFKLINIKKEVEKEKETLAK